MAYSVNWIKGVCLPLRYLGGMTNMMIVFSFQTEQHKYFFLLCPQFTPKSHDGFFTDPQEEKAHLVNQ